MSATSATCTSAVADVSLRSLPEDVLLLICHFIDAHTLHTLSVASVNWRSFIHTRVWPRRLAFSLGVRAIRFAPPVRTSTTLRFISRAEQVRSCEWMRILHTFETYPSSRQLCICVALREHDSVTSLALRYAVSIHDILRANALFAEHQLACRTHLFVPLMDDGAVRAVTGVARHLHTPVLVTDVTLSNKYFLVVEFRGAVGDAAGLTARRHSEHTYVRQLLVKLMAKGLSVSEDEVRYYLEENDFDVGKAYKQLLLDHQFGP